MIYQVGITPVNYSAVWSIWAVWFGRLVKNIRPSNFFYSAFRIPPYGLVPTRRHILPIHDLFVSKQNNKKVKISFFSSPPIPKSFKVKPQLKDVVLELASEIFFNIFKWDKESYLI